MIVSKPERHVFGQLSAISFRRRPIRDCHSSCCGIEDRSQGVCYIVSCVVVASNDAKQNELALHEHFPFVCGGGMTDSAFAARVVDMVQDCYGKRTMGCYVWRQHTPDSLLGLELKCINRNEVAGNVAQMSRRPSKVSTLTKHLRYLER